MSADLIAAEAAREVEEANARHAAELKELADEKAEMAADIADLREEVQSGKKAALVARLVDQQWRNFQVKAAAL